MKNVIGPRNSVVAHLQGLAYDLLRDTSPFITTGWMEWRDLPELWIDRIHDYVAEDDE